MDGIIGGGTLGFQQTVIRTLEAKFKNPQERMGPNKMEVPGSAAEPSVSDPIMKWVLMWRAMLGS